jgi:hypoxanthine phosphoribosyltransferase
MERLDQDIDTVLFDAETIATRVTEIGQQLAEDFHDRRPLVVGILNGCFVFMADLCRAMDIPMDVDFMSVSSYGAGTKSSGVVRLIKDLNKPIDGRHVLLVEDIIDSGLTLAYLQENLLTRNPASLTICTLLNKVDARTKDIEVKYAGFTCPDAFVVGYGLDYDGLYRNLPYIGELSPRVYEGRLK